jgi:hypothetical protein
MGEASSVQSRGSGPAVQNALERLLSVNVATLVVLSTLLLGVGQQHAGLPALMLIAACASLWLTDLTGRLRLNRTLSNVAMLGAVLVCFWDLFRKAATPEIVVMGRLLAYLEIVLLFQKKDLRAWVQLMVLSLIQVAVATLVRQGVWFGLLALVYLFLGLSAMVLLFLQFERTYYFRNGGTRVSSASSRGGFRQQQVDWHRLGKIALATLVVGPLSLFLRYRESPDWARPDEGRANPGGTGRWPLMSQQAISVAPEPLNRNPEGLGWELWACLVKLLPATLLVAAIVFPLVPRFGRFDLGLYRVGWFSSRDDRTAPIRTVGYSDRVALGELGPLSDDQEPVGQVAFIDPASEMMCEIKGEIYLRGAVLTRYRDGQWSYHGPGYRPARRTRPGMENRVVRQIITVEPMDRRELFCVWPFSLRGSSRVYYNDRFQRLMRMETDRNKQFTFQLDTTAFVDGALAALIPGDYPIETGHLTELPSDPIPRLEALAAEWIAQSGTPENDRAGRARLLESKLRDSGRFQYSATGVPRDEQLDPIEDFVANNPSGNCEYFATALALMLRSQGIPARIVVGYKTAEYSHLTDVYRVRQSHAHTWVEAYVAPEHLPEDRPGISQFPDWSHGAWLRLDPTPARDVTAVQALFGGVENWFQWIRQAWDKYVLDMNHQRQRDSVYGPLGNSVRQGTGLLSADSWGNIWHALCRTPGKILSFILEGRWLSLRGALVAVVALALLYVAYRVARFGLRPARTCLARRRRRGAGPQRILVAFYRRLETLLARRGLARLASQTHREFAAEAGRQIAESAGQPNLADLPAEIAEAFYQVRFGGVALDGHQTESVERALGRLEQAVDGNHAKQ